jgi:hypothetical protein
MVEQFSGGLVYLVRAKTDTTMRTLRFHRR